MSYATRINFDESDGSWWQLLQTRSSATAEIVRDAETAIQGHSRSSVVVLIDAAYMSSC